MTILIQLLEAAALAHLDKCAHDREANYAFDAGEFSGGPRPGEMEAHAVLHESGFYREFLSGQAADLV